jgi:hypothetical protein
MSETSPSENHLFTLGHSAPQVADSAWIAPGAVVIGDVHIGPGSSIWFHCVLRGDTNMIRSAGSRTSGPQATSASSRFNRSSSLGIRG